MGARFRIRVAEPDDAARLEVLERRCFSDPWSRAGLREMLESGQVVARLAESGKSIATGNSCQQGPQWHATRSLLASQGRSMNHRWCAQPWAMSTNRE